jgi:hypothetical protein
MTDRPLTFFASLTDSPSVIVNLQRCMSAPGVSVRPLDAVLTSPLFVSPRSLDLLRQMSDQGARILFDSGGYYVQTGRIRYEELYMPLLDTYRAHDWATLFTLPDHVPTSRDKGHDVARKVDDTVRNGQLFFDELPDALRARAMPVVQGHTRPQVEQCLAAYIELGVRHIGFGSFGTGGKGSEVNVTTQQSVKLARHVIDVAHKHGMKVHLFGIGRPALVGMLKGIGADSFDSTAWLRAAGFGTVFLPFMRGYNITYRNINGKVDVGITFDEFRQLAELTRHRCPYCASLELLYEKKLYRAAHNLIVMAECVATVNAGDYDHIEQIYRQGSKKYREEFHKWLAPDSWST